MSSFGHRSNTGKSRTPTAQCDPLTDTSHPYLDALQLIERLHRRLIDTIQDDLDRRGEREINGAQALLLFNVGTETLTQRDLRSRYHYISTNLSYTLKKLIHSDYLLNERTEPNRRPTTLRLTDKGRNAREIVSTLFDKHLERLNALEDVASVELDGVNATLKSLNRFWIEQICLPHQ
jgi:DNA-binding MarR family transcriptional regulator